MKTCTYKAKGYLNFGMALSNGEYDYCTQIVTKKYLIDTLCKGNFSSDYRKSITEMVNSQLTFNNCTLIDGIDFLANVKHKDIMNYDGFIANVFVDGYKSNLGLYTDTFSDGQFLVNEKLFAKICEKYKVEIDWANK